MQSRVCLCVCGGEGDVVVDVFVCACARVPGVIARGKSDQDKGKYLGSEAVEPLVFELSELP